VVLEASAGTTHLFRIVPVLVPPNTDLKADHTHQLKVTLNGKKQKGDKQLSGKLADSCRERVSDKDGKPSVAGLGRDANQPTDFCGTEAGRLLESIVQALEKGSSSAGQ
jgi:hypothetical protein